MIASTLPTSTRLRVRVTSAGLPGGMELFTPRGSMRWGNCDFILNAPNETEADFWIVFGNAFPHETGRVAPVNTLFIAAEPPAKKIYPHNFYRQFQHLVDTHNNSRHPHAHLDALGLCWLVGFSWKQNRFTIGYDALKQLSPPQKQNRISVVCSTTAQTAGQKRRLKFLAALKQRLGDDLVIFGKGFQLVDDKLEAALPYRYQLVLENSQSLHYWTEKLTDAYLGWAFPLYVGCPNLSDYFTSDSFQALDMNDVAGAEKTIRQLLAKPIAPTELTALRTAREKVLDIYNPFARFAYWTNRFYQPGPKEKITLQSEKAFRFVRGWFYRWQQRNFTRPPSQA
jgi:hypothetical protein